MERVIDLTSIEQYNALLGQPHLSPYLGIIPAKVVSEYMAVRGDFYAMYFRRACCGDKRYGCEYYDFQAATLVFKSPGEIIEIDPVNHIEELAVAGIVFEPELLDEALFDDKRKEYTFFAYHECESLHLSKRELEVIIRSTVSLKDELLQKKDTHTRQLISEHLALLLDHCLRFYERQFILRSDLYRPISCQTGFFVKEYFQSEQAEKSEQSALQYIRRKMPFSSAYLDDLLRVETGMTLSEHIRIIRMELVKEQILYSDKPLSEIVNELGFPNFQALSYLFRKFFGCSPNEYRRAMNFKPN